MFVLRLVFSFLVIAVLAWSPNSAEAQTHLGPAGGPGGGYFSLPCPKNEYVLGFALHSGATIDAIRANCMAFNKTTGQWISPPHFTNFTGGPGGGLQQNGCPGDRYLSGIRIGVSMVNGKLYYVDFVEMSCSVLTGYGGDTKVCLATGAGCWTGAGTFNLACPKDQSIYSIFGRSGIYLDSLGVSCMQRPKPAVVATTNNPPPWQRPPGTTTPTPTPTPSPATPTPPVCPQVAGDPVPAEWADMLAVHNERRKAHCACPLVWSAKLSQGSGAAGVDVQGALPDGAQGYATACVLNKHETSGENMANAWGVRNNVPVLPSQTDRMAYENAWYCERNNYNFTNPVFVGGFTANCGQGNNPKVNGHLTQILWKDTKMVGCGRAQCKIPETDAKGNVIATHEGTQWVCRYSPAGNTGTDAATLKREVSDAVCK